MLGVIAAQTGQPERAFELIGKAVALNANVAVAHNNLGNALRDSKRLEEALASLDKAIALQPDYADAHNNRRLALQDLKRSDEARESFDRAIALKQDFAEAHHNRGAVLRKQPEEALASFDKAIAFKPDYAEAHGNRGLALQDPGRSEEALASFDRAIALRPDLAEAHHNRGSALRRRPEEALATYDRAIELKPDYAATYANRCLALQGLKFADEALASCDKAIALKPDIAEAHQNRGLALMKLKRREEALTSYEKAIALKPDYAEAYKNLAVALQHLARSEEALAAYDSAIAFKPDYTDARCNQGQCMLLTGRFEQGWRQYEWRKRQAAKIAAPAFSQLLWLGEESIAGKTLFVQSEQGLGDTIQFCRYAKLAEARGAKVIMSAQRPLRGLLERLSPTIQVIASNEAPTEFDYHCPMLSLPLAFRTTLVTIPAEQRYLAADDERRAAWEARLPQTDKPRIGVVWSGNPVHKNDHNRSMGLGQFLPMPGADAEWVCLQKESRDKDAAVLRQDGRIAFFGDELGDFRDTAALVDLMDLVITVDTSVAHLAGAMGKPVWILLPFNPDWRWLLDRDDSPWYPTARLFRQRQIEDWTGVIEQGNTALRSNFPPQLPGATSWPTINSTASPNPATRIAPR